MLTLSPSVPRTVLIGSLLCPLVARAQQPAPGDETPAARTAIAVETEPLPDAEQPAPAPAVTPTPTEAAPPGSSPAAPPGSAAPTAPPPAAEAADEDEDASVPGWFRIDSDLLGLQLWVGATHSLGPVDIATDIYVNSGSFAEFDIGPSFTAELGDSSSLIVTPMAGLGVDWTQKRALTLVAPQLFLYLTLGPVYFESWTQAFFNSVFVEGANNDIYLRNFLLVSLTDNVAIGPHMEATLALNNDRNTLVSLPLQGAVSLSYGQNNTLLLALGYETVEAARQVDTGAVDEDAAPVFAERGLAGRFTFVRTW